MPLVAPPPPPEGGSSLKAADLKNTVCILQPVQIGLWPAKPAEVDENGEVTKKAQPEREYLECNVWTLDRAGVTGEHTGVRVSWWKGVDQLKKNGIGSYTGCKPIELDDRSVILRDLEGDALKIAEEVVAKLEAGEDPTKF